MRIKMKIDEKDKKFLEHIKDSQAMLDANDISGLLDALDDFMTTDGYAPPDYQELNDIGRQAEQILDRIYYNS